MTAWARDVANGRVLAGPHVRAAARRHLDDLEVGHRRGLVWNAEAARRAIGFFADVLRLNGGQFEGLPFVLHPSQAFRVGSLFGWKRVADNSRRFRRFYDEEGKGNGKSPMLAGIGLYGLVADGEARAEVYAAGATKDQAMVLFRDAVAMVDQSPALEARITKSGGTPVWNLADLRTGSFFRPISREARKTGSGPRPHIALCDEVHEHPDRYVIDTLERGFKFRRQPLLAMATNAGTDRNSVCWEEREHAIKVAHGEVLDDSTFAFVCALDEDDDPLEDPACWGKANPLLGVTIQEEYLAGRVALAKAIPGKLNGILRMNFAVWTDSSSAWMARQALEAVLADFDLVEHAGKRVWLGVDLSGRQDLTAIAGVVETGMCEVAGPDGGLIELPTYDAWAEAWTPGDTLHERALRDKAPYDEWVRAGDLHAPPGRTIRLDFVAARIAELARRFEIAELAYDRYAYDKLAAELDELGLTIRQVAHPQGGKRRARLPEQEVAAAKRAGLEAPQGLWMPGSIATLETLILERRIRLRRGPVLVSAAMSAAIDADAYENRWFSKQRATNRIDAIVALAMAVGAATRGREEPDMSYIANHDMVVL